MKSKKERKKNNWYMFYLKKKRNIDLIIKKLKKYDVEYYLFHYKAKNDNHKKFSFDNYIFIKTDEFEKIFILTEAIKGIKIIGDPFPESFSANEINKIKRLE